jgi:hypothetical protein
VEDGVDAEAGFGDGGCVGEVGLDEVDGGGDVAQVAGGEVVEAADVDLVAARVFAAGEKGVGEVRSEEAGDAGDEVGSQED